MLLPPPTTLYKLSTSGRWRFTTQSRSRRTTKHGTAIFSRRSTACEKKPSPLAKPVSRITGPSFVTSPPYTITRHPRATSPQSTSHPCKRPSRTGVCRNRWSLGKLPPISKVDHPAQPSLLQLQQSLLLQGVSKCHQWYPRATSSPHRNRRRRRPTRERESRRGRVLGPNQPRLPPSSSTTTMTILLQGTPFPPLTGWTSTR